MKTLLPFLLLVIFSSNIKSQTITCPPDVDIRLIDVPLDKNFGEPTTTATGNFKIEKSFRTKDFGCNNDTTVIDSITYKLKINNQLKASCTQVIIIRQLEISDLTFPDTAVIFNNENISAFDKSISGEIYPTYKELPYSSKLGISSTDFIIGLETDFPKIIRTWIVLDWCKLESIEFLQVIKINNKKSIEGLEVRTLNGVVINNINYKIRVSEQCSTFIDNEPILIECELLNKKRITFDTLEANGLPSNISALDLILIQRHILGIKKFDKTWQLFAADVNTDSKITASDLVTIRKNILGLSNDLKNSSFLLPYKNKDLLFQSNITNPYIQTNYYDYDISGIIDNKYVILGISKGDVNGQ